MSVKPNILHSQPSYSSQLAECVPVNNVNSTFFDKPLMLSLRMATQLMIKCNVFFQDPGRIWPGKRMAGHMGNKNCTKFAVRVSVSIFTDSILV